MSADDQDQQPPAEPIIAPSFAAPIPAKVYDEIRAVEFARLADAAIGFRAGMAEWEVENEKHRAVVSSWPMLNFNPPPPPPLRPVAPAFMICGALGIGETWQWIELIAIPHIVIGSMVVISVPRLELADEIAKLFADRGVDAAVYRGRDATDPNTSPKVRMCRESDRVKAIEFALGKAQQRACKNKDRECEFYKTCGYQKQQNLTPQVWIITHPLLFIERPEFIPQPGHICSDGTFWNQSIRGADLKYSISLKELRQYRPIYTGKGALKKLEVEATNDLDQISKRIAAAIEADGMGRIRRDALVAAGITVEDVIAAERFEWRRKDNLTDVLPGMEAKKAIDYCEKVDKQNQQVARLVRFFKLLARTLDRTDCDRSLWLELRPNDAKEPAVFITWRRDVHDTWSPTGTTAILSSMMRPAIVRQFFPNISVPTLNSVAMPPTSVIQIVDKAMTEDYGLRNVKELRWHIEIRAAETDGKILVVCQASIEDALCREFVTAGPAMPKNVTIAHFNGVSGLSAWHDVKLLIVIGRTEPSPRTTERMSRAFFEREVIEVQPNEHGQVWYLREPIGIRMRNGSITKVVGHRHPDWRVETIRWSICESEIMNALAAGGGVLRTAANPLRLEILCSVPLAVEVDEVTTWEGGMQPGRLQVAWARGGLPESHGDRARAFPDMYKSAAGAESDMRREAERRAEGKTPCTPLYAAILSSFLTNKGVQGVSSIAYRRTGARGPATRLFYPPDRTTDPEAWITKHLGPVTIIGEPESVEIPTQTQTPKASER